MKWVRFIKLPVDEKSLFVKVSAILLLTRIGLILFPYKSVLSRFQRAAESVSPTPIDAEAADFFVERLVYLTNAAGRRVLGPRPCLPIALAVECLLKRRGIDAALRIGVTKGENEELLAHAWVERDGDVIIGGRLSHARYARLQPLKPEAR